MSFGGSFWNILNFSHSQSSHIDELLSQPDVTLEQLLDEDTIISEFKGMNSRLLEYQTDDKVKQLLSYLIEEPAEDADRNRGYKYPFVACEILTADIQTLLSAFFGRNPNNYKRREEQEKSQGSTSREIEEEQNNSKNDSENEEKKETHDNEELEEGEIKENDDNKKEEAAEEPKETKDENEASEKQDENKENIDAEKEGGKESEIQIEKEEEGEKENKENVATENEDSEEPKKKERYSITVRSPQNDEESVQSEEEEVDPKMDLAHYFFSFLNSETLNVTLVGYFSRFLNHLLLKRATETVEFIWNNPYIVEGLIRHVEHNSIADCLAKLFCMEGLPSTLVNDFVDVRLRKLSQLADIFDTEASELSKKSETILYSCNVLVEVITRRTLVLKGLELTNFFFSKDFLEPFFNNLFRHPILETYLSSILNALLLAVLHKKENKRSEDEESENNDESTITIDFDESLFFELLAPKIGEIAEFLETATEKEVGRTYGGTQKVFGVGKLRLVESLLHMVKLNVNKISMEIGLKKIFGVLLDLMVHHEWNNMLHNHIERIIISTLESDSHVLKQKLLNQANLVGFLNEATKEVYYKMPNEQKRKMRKGYLGHVTRIGKALEKLAEVDSDIKEHLTNEKWTEFQNSYLKPSVKNENHDLAGFSKKKSEDILDDNIHIGNNVDEALKGKFDMFFSFDVSPPAQEDNGTGFFESYEKELEAWQEQNKTGNVTNDANNFWENNNKASQEFFFSFPEGKQPEEGSGSQQEKEDIYLKLNSEVKIINMEQSKEVEIQAEFLESQFWARPTGTTSQVDDILKEFESI